MLERKVAEESTSEQEMRWAEEVITVLKNNGEVYRHIECPLVGQVVSPDQWKNFTEVNHRPQGEWVGSKRNPWPALWLRWKGPKLTWTECGVGSLHQVGAYESLGGSLVGEEMSEEQGRFSEPVCREQRFSGCRSSQ